MYSKVVLNIFNNPSNAGRISKPDGIADMYNADQTAHVEFSLRIENGIITNCNFRAQANPYIIAICSTITKMVKGKMVSMVFLDPYSIKEQLGDHLDTDIMFCIDCLKLAINDYKEKLEKEAKSGKKVLEEDSITLDAKEQLIQPVKEISDDIAEEDLTDEDFGFFDDIDIEEDTQPQNSKVEEEDDDLTDEDFGFFDDIDEDEQF